MSKDSEPKFELEELIQRVSRASETKTRCQISAEEFHFMLAAGVKDFRWIDLAANADLSGMELRGLLFCNADLRTANFSNSDLTKTNFGHALLGSIDFSGADFTRTLLVDANCNGAKFHGAKLDGLYMPGVDIGGAEGIWSAGPVGKHNRIVLANISNNAPVFYAGCCTADYEDMKGCIERDYGTSGLLPDYLATLDYLYGMALRYMERQAAETN